MAKVPTYDNFQEQSRALPGARVESAISPDMLNADAKQTEKLGAGLLSAGVGADAIAYHMAVQANQTRVDDALNQLRKHVLDAALDPKEGYLSLKGSAALNRPDNKSLSEEYDERLNQRYGAILQSLGNDEQRRLFTLRGNNILTEASAGVKRHALGEYRDFAISTQSGALHLGQEEAKANWNNPDRIRQIIDGYTVKTYGGDGTTGAFDTAGVGGGVDTKDVFVPGLKANALKLADLRGRSANEAAVEIKQAVSAVHTTVVRTALEQNNPTYALAYLDDKSKAGEIMADDGLKLRALVDKDVQARIADGTATAVMADVRRRAVPNERLALLEARGDMKHDPSNDAILRSVNRQVESNNNDKAVSPTGVKFAAQVTDKTARAPGFGIKPAESKTADEYNRVGDELIVKLVQRYGYDVAKGFAAYNAGAGNVDKAIEDAKTRPGATWLGSLSQFVTPEKYREVLAHVERAVPAYQKAITQRTPTLQDAHDAARERLGPGAQPAVVAAAQAGVTKQYNDWRASQKQAGEDAVSDAQRWLDQNGGDFLKMPTSLREAVRQNAPGRVDDLIKYAENVSPGAIVRTNMEALGMALAHPDELAKMPESVFQNFLKGNFNKSDHEKIVTLRSNALSGKVDAAPSSINHPAFNAAVDERLNALGISAKPKPDDTAGLARVATVKNYIASEMQKVQMQTGKKMNEAEVRDYVLAAFARNTQVRNWLFFSKDIPLFGATASDVPSADVKAITEAYKKRGAAAPTESDILRAYLEKQSQAQPTWGTNEERR